MDQELIKHYGSIQQAANAQSAYLHDLGLFHAEIVIDELVKQRDELLEALKFTKLELDKFNNIRGGAGVLFGLCEVINSAIANAEK